MRDITFTQAVRFLDGSFKRIGKQTTVRGLLAEVQALANYFIALEARSPIRAVWEYDLETVQSMDVSRYPRLQAMKRQVVIEMLASADAASPSYYTANPFGLPFRRRVDAALPILTTFMETAMKVSRANTQKAVSRRRRIRR